MLQTYKVRRLKKLNFGCGYDKREGYLNVDVDPVCKPDLLIKNNDFSKIPLNHYEEILANDVLEHIPRTQTLKTLLEWSRYLKPKGRLQLQSTSVLGVAKQLEKKNAKFADQHGWLTCLFGNQAHEGDFHHNGFTETTLRTYLLAAGYKIDSFELRDKWLFHVNAHLAYDWTATLKKYARDSDEKFTQAIFKEAFGRKPDAMGEQYILEALRSKSLGRLGALEHLLRSPERLYYTAKQNGL